MKSGSMASSNGSHAYKKKKKRGRRKFGIEDARTEQLDGGIPHNLCHVSVSVSVSLSEQSVRKCHCVRPGVTPAAWDSKGYSRGAPVSRWGQRSRIRGVAPVIVVDGGDLRLRALNANPATSSLWPCNTQIRPASSSRGPGSRECEICHCF